MSKFAGLGLSVDSPFPVPLTHPVTGVPLRDRTTGVEASITVLGGDSEAAQQAQRRNLNARLSQRLRGTVTAEQLDAEEVELLASLTQSWVLVDLAGNRLDIECTAQNARELYADPKTKWVREQVRAGIDDRKNVKTA